MILIVGFVIICLVISAILWFLIDVMFFHITEPLLFEAVLNLGTIHRLLARLFGLSRPTLKVVKMTSYRYSYQMDLFVSSKFGKLRTR